MDNDSKNPGVELMEDGFKVKCFSIFDPFFKNKMLKNYPVYLRNSLFYNDENI